VYDWLLVGGEEGGVGGVLCLCGENVALDPLLMESFGSIPENGGAVTVCRDRSRGSMHMLSSLAMLDGVVSEASFEDDEEKLDFAAERTVLEVLDVSSFEDDNAEAPGTPVSSLAGIRAPGCFQPIWRTRLSWWL